MDRRNWLAAGLASAGAISIGAAFWWPESEEERIERVLRELARTVSFAKPIQTMVFAARLDSSFESLLSPLIETRLAGLGTELPPDRRELAITTAGVLKRFGSFHVHLSDLRIDVISSSAARAWATARVKAQRGAAIQQANEAVRFELVDSDGWRVRSIESDRGVDGPQ